MGGAVSRPRTGDGEGGETEGTGDGDRPKVHIPPFWDRCRHRYECVLPVPHRIVSVKAALSLLMCLFLGSSRVQPSPVLPWDGLHGARAASSKVKPSTDRRGRVP